MTTACPRRDASKTADVGRYLVDCPRVCSQGCAPRDGPDGTPEGAPEPLRDWASRGLGQLSGGLRVSIPGSQDLARPPASGCRTRGGAPEPPPASEATRGLGHVRRCAGIAETDVAMTSLGI